MTDCDCARNLHVRLGRQNEYAAAKRILNVGRHPTFIGRGLVQRAATNGGLLFATHAGEDVAVAIINPRTSNLLVLNVLPAHRSHGLGTAFLAFVRPNFARVLESAVPWFERQGYKSVGALKQGRTLRTQVMVRGELIGLAGRVSRLLVEPEQAELAAHRDRPAELPRPGEPPVHLPGHGPAVAGAVHDVNELDAAHDRAAG